MLTFACTCLLKLMLREGWVSGGLGHVNVRLYLPLEVDATCGWVDGGLGGWGMLTFACTVAGTQVIDRTWDHMKSIEIIYSMQPVIQKVECAGYHGNYHEALPHMAMVA